MTKLFNLILAITALAFAYVPSTAFAASAAKNKEALEFYKLAKDAGTCEMFLVVVEDFPGTTAAKLSKISYKDCIKNEVGSSSNTNNNSNNNSSSNNNSNNNNSGNNNSNSNNSSNNNNSGSNSGNCYGYWDGSYCVDNRHDLTVMLQESLKNLGCRIGRADGVWGKKTTAAIAAANREFGTRLRKSSNNQTIGVMIVDVENSSYNFCSCPSGEYLNSKGLCVRKKAVVNNSRGKSLFQVRNVASNDTLNMRSRATASSSIVDRIVWDGTHVTADESICRANSVGWVHVEWGGSTGWVASRYLISMSTGRVACK